ncbi:general transcription factor 3C polypeptide 1 [Caerostris extrusa]|uniref:General transcription factor 3C polypeptide 1 n=1 Tax=Caerostris extrusa TaxID=172846 RepID=A0AAV4PNY5_CAEEX|nr:general transcription factor 3C polypeptide 1 [Caerostris extrusa]
MHDTIAIQQFNDSLASEGEHRNSLYASRFALYILRKELSLPTHQKFQHSQDYIVLNSCRVICRLKSDEVIPDLPIIPEGVVENVSESEEVKGPICLTKDQLKLTANQISEIFHQLVHVMSSDVFLSNKNYSAMIETLYEKYSDQTLQDAKLIFSEIFCYRAVGSGEKKIWKYFRALSGELSVFEHLNILRRSCLVIRAGVASFTYVCGCFAQNWVLSAYRLSDFPSPCQKRNAALEEEECLSENPNVAVLPYSEADSVPNGVDSGTVACDQVSSSVTSKSVSPSVRKREKLYFIPRTWRNPDSSLNEPAFFDLLSTILSYIISMPGVSSSRVCEKFSGVTRS